MNKAPSRRKIDSPKSLETKIIIGRPIRRMFLDIEVSYNIVSTWRTGYKINLGPENIIKERAIICACWKFQGESRVHSVQWDKNQCDKALLIKLSEAINEADEIVMHNGDKFDLPWIRTRCLFHKLPPLPSDIKTVDTLKWARRLYYFNSNKLDYIAQYLGLGGKLKTGFDLWKNIVLHKDDNSLIKMVTYCKRDTTLLEKVWEILRVTVKHKTHTGVLLGGSSWMCPHTGSTNVKTSKTKISASGTTSYQMQSLENGAYYTISAKAHEDYLEAKKRK